MVIEILVNFTDNNFITTKFYGTLSEAKEYYSSNAFTNTDEKSIKAVGVYLYDPWKFEVLKFCMENNNTLLKFDDENKQLTFNTKYNDMITIEYDKVTAAMHKVNSL